MSTTVESKSPGNRTIVEGMRLVADFEQSGLSQAAYARPHGVSDKSMSYWVRRVRSLQKSAQSQLSAPIVRPSPSLAHVADVGSDGAISLARSSSTTTTSMVAPPAAMLSRVGAGVGIEIRCGGRSLVVGPGFDRELLGEVVRFLEGLPTC
jgi:hypothetical protein